jgi:hypothetical protein
MDGRVQLPVISYLRQRFQAVFVDVVTGAGPVAVLCDPERGAAAREIRDCVAVSMDRHQSRGLAVVAHHDCAGNPVSPDTQREQLRAAVSLLEERFSEVPVIALWVDEEWEVQEVS